MSNPDEPSRYDELAALHAVDLLDDVSRRELLAAAERDPAVESLVRDYAETAALLAYEAPQIKPAPGLRAKILRQLPAPSTAAAKSNIIPFSQWAPYAIAACLMALGIIQSHQIGGLQSQLLAIRNDAEQFRTDAEQLRASNALVGLRLATLQAKEATKNAAYAAAKIVVAWDPTRHQGVVSLQDLPPAPFGKVYQLWVLDSTAPAPVSAGVVSASRPFVVNPVGTPNPGFAVSLEPAGGVPEPTGPILFAVAPGL